MNRNTEQVLRQLEDTCGCTYAARTAAEAMRGLVAEHQEMVTAMTQAVLMLQVGGPEYDARDVQQVLCAALQKVGAV